MSTCLNIIRDLLQLGFSMKQVKTYLDCKNLEHTLIMLEDEKRKYGNRKNA